MFNAEWLSKNMAKVQTINRSWLVWEWLLDGNALDTSGSGNNGTATNVTYTGTDRGYQSQTGVFDGSSSKVVAASYAFNGVASITISLWFYATNVSGFKMIYMNRTDAGSHYHYIALNGSGVDFVMDGTWAGPTAISSTTVFTANTWYHIVATYDSTTMRLYVNGVSDQSGTAQSWTVELDSGATVRLWVNVTTQWFWGNIQWVRSFNRLVSQQEIQSLYMEGLRKLSGAGLAPLTDGLVAYYDFNGDANDIVGGNNWTLTNAPTISTDQLSMSNRAYSFNGSSNYITLPSSTMNNLAAGSISVWVKRGSVNNQESFFDKLQTGVSNHIQFMYENLGTGANKIRWRINDQTLASAAWVTDTNWHHWVGTFSSAWMNLYKDGVLENSNATNAQLANYSVGITVWQVNSWAYLAWSLTDVMCFNRVLSASEVLTLYTLSSQRYLTPLLH